MQGVFDHLSLFLEHFDVVVKVFDLRGIGVCVIHHLVIRQKCLISLVEGLGDVLDVVDQGSLEELIVILV